MRENYIRLLVPNESPYPVGIFKLIINPTFTNETVVLLHLQSMSVCVMPVFAIGC